MNVFEVCVHIKLLVIIKYLRTRSHLELKKTIYVNLGGIL